MLLYTSVVIVAFACGCLFWFAFRARSKERAVVMVGLLVVTCGTVAALKQWRERNEEHPTMSFFAQQRPSEVPSDGYVG